MMIVARPDRRVLLLAVLLAGSSRACRHPGGRPATVGGPRSGAGGPGRRLRTYQVVLHHAAQRGHDGRVVVAHSQPQLVHGIEAALAFQ
jgi:hypothetical protein